MNLFAITVLFSSSLSAFKRPILIITSIKIMILFFLLNFYPTSPETLKSLNGILAQPLLFWFDRISDTKSLILDRIFHCFGCSVKRVRKKKFSISKSKKDRSFNLRVHVLQAYNVCFFYKSLIVAVTYSIFLIYFYTSD